MFRFFSYLQNKKHKKLCASVQDMIVDDVKVVFIRKRIKNIHIRVSAPGGKVTVSAPLRAATSSVYSLVYRKLNWIKSHQQKIAALPVRFVPRFITGEQHLFFGDKFLLKVHERCIDGLGSRSARVALVDRSIEMHGKLLKTIVQRERVLTRWYRAELESAIIQLIAKWEPVMKVKVSRFGIRRMKSRWGTCHCKQARIWINLELVKTPPQCLEFVVVHEMVHLLEPGHNKRFYGFMDRYLPSWRLAKQDLTRLASEVLS